MEKYYKPALIILALAAVLLFVLHFTDREDKSADQPAMSTVEPTEQPGTLKVAYVFVDSVLANYDYYKVLADQLLSNKASLEKELAQKGEAFQKDVAAFQNKVDKHLITSWDAETEQKKLGERQQVLVNLQNDMQQRLLEHEQTVNQQIHDSVMSAVNYVNSLLGYNVILSNTFGGGLLYAEPFMNITPQVLDRMNDNYRKTLSK